MWRQAASQGGVGWKGAMERRKGRVTWPAPRAQATSFHSLSLSFSSSSPSLFLSPLCFSFNTSPPPSYPCLCSVARYSVANPGGRGWGEARWSAGASASLRAGAADKRPLCQLKKRLSQDPPFSTKHRISRPPGERELPLDHTCLLFFFSLSFIASLQTPGNLFSNVNILL